MASFLKALALIVGLSNIQVALNNAQGSSNIVPRVQGVENYGAHGSSHTSAHIDFDGLPSLVRRGGHFNRPGGEKFEKQGVEEEGEIKTADRDYKSFINSGDSHWSSSRPAELNPVSVIGLRAEDAARHIDSGAFELHRFPPPGIPYISQGNKITDAKNNSGKPGEGLINKGSSTLGPGNIKPTRPKRAPQVSPEPSPQSRVDDWGKWYEENIPDGKNPLKPAEQPEPVNQPGDISDTEKIKLYRNRCQPQPGADDVAFFSAMDEITKADCSKALEGLRPDAENSSGGSSPQRENPSSDGSIPGLPIPPPEIHEVSATSSDPSTTSNTDSPSIHDITTFDTLPTPDTPSSPIYFTAPGSPSTLDFVTAPGTPATLDLGSPLDTPSTPFSLSSEHPIRPDPDPVLDPATNMAMGSLVSRTTSAFNQIKADGILTNSNAKALMDAGWGVTEAATKTAVEAGIDMNDIIAAKGVISSLAAMPRILEAAGTVVTQAVLDLAAMAADPEMLEAADIVMGGKLIADAAIQSAPTIMLLASGGLGLAAAGGQSLIQATVSGAQVIGILGNAALQGGSTAVGGLSTLALGGIASATSLAPGVARSVLSWMLSNEKKTQIAAAAAATTTTTSVQVQTTTIEKHNTGNISEITVNKPESGKLVTAIDTNTISSTWAKTTSPQASETERAQTSQATAATSSPQLTNLPWKTASTQSTRSTRGNSEQPISPTASVTPIPGQISRPTWSSLPKPTSATSTEAGASMIGFVPIPIGEGLSINNTGVLTTMTTTNAVQTTVPTPLSVEAPENGGYWSPSTGPSVLNDSTNVISPKEPSGSVMLSTTSAIPVQMSTERIRNGTYMPPAGLNGYTNNISSATQGQFEVLPTKASTTESSTMATPISTKTNVEHLPFPTIGKFQPNKALPTMGSSINTTATTTANFVRKQLTTLITATRPTKI